MKGEEEGVEPEPERDPPPAELCRRERVPAGGDGGEGHRRGDRREPVPAIAEGLASLGVDRARADERQEKERPEQDERGGIAVRDQVRRRPDGDPGEEGMAGDAQDGG